MGYQINSYYKSQYTGQQIENALSAFKNMAAEYSQNESYNVGDVVLYGNGLYVCTGSTTGAFDPTKWQQTTLAEIFANLGATYSDPNNDGNVVVGVNSTVGEKILRSISFPSLTNRYYLPFAQYIRTEAANDPDNASFDVEIPDAEEAPMHSTVIKGKTSVVNQLIPHGNFDNVNYWGANRCTITASGNKLTATMASNVNQAASIYQTGLAGAVAGHKYFITATITSSRATHVNLTGFGKTIVGAAVSANTRTVLSGIDVCTASNTNVYIYPSANNELVENDTAVCENFMLVDLTTIFSAADLATIGTSVDTFKTLFLKQKGYPLPTYIPYDAGSLANVNGTYRMRGRNLWDEEWEYGNIDDTNGENSGTSTSFWRAKNYIAVTEGETYCQNTDGYVGNFRHFFYDVNKQHIKTSTPTATTVDGKTIVVFTVPAGARFMRFRFSTPLTNYKNCINISDPSYNGTYFPYYNGGEIDLSASSLNGVGTAQDEKDFATGERTTRIGMVDLGTLNWTYNTTDAANPLFFATIPDATGYVDGICGKYTKGTNLYSAVDKTWTWANYHNTKELNIFDSNYTTSAAFKTAMSGTYFAYILATPVVSTETPQPLETQYGYNVLEPVSGGVQSASVDTVYYENIAGYIDKKLAEG